MLRTYFTQYANIMQRTIKLLKCTISTQDRTKWRQTIFDGVSLKHGALQTKDAKRQGRKAQVIVNPTNLETTFNFNVGGLTCNSHIRLSMPNTLQEPGPNISSVIFISEDNATTTTNCRREAATICPAPAI